MNRNTPLLPTFFLVLFSLILCLSLSAIYVEGGSLPDSPSNIQQIHPPDHVPKPYSDYAVASITVSRNARGVISAKAILVNKGGISRRDIKIAFSVNNRSDLVGYSGQLYGLSTIITTNRKASIKAELIGTGMTKDFNNKNNSCKVAMGPGQTRASRICIPLL